MVTKPRNTVDPRPPRISRPHLRSGQVPNRPDHVIAPTGIVVLNVDQGYIIDTKARAWVNVITVSIEKVELVVPEFGGG